MLVVCNGAYKSGSSWLFHIVCALRDVRFPDRAYQNPAWKKVPSIDPARLGAFLRDHDLARADYATKQHFFRPEERDLLFAHPAVRILDVERDLRDVVVSAYHHHVRLGRFCGSFESFYRVEGRLVAHRVRAYHRFWKGPADKVLVASYERLHEDFDAEVSRIAAFLGWPLEPDRLHDVRKRTTLGELRARHGESGDAGELRFYRKGVMGDWQTHMTAAMVEDMAQIEAAGLPPAQRAGCVLRTKLHRAFRAWPKTRLRRLDQQPTSG